MFAEHANQRDKDKNMEVPTLSMLYGDTDMNATCAANLQFGWQELSGNVAAYKAQIKNKNNNKPLQRWRLFLNFILKEMFF